MNIKCQLYDSIALLCFQVLGGAQVSVPGIIDGFFGNPNLICFLLALNIFLLNICLLNIMPLTRNIMFIVNKFFPSRFVSVERPQGCRHQRF